MKDLSDLDYNYNGLIKKKNQYLREYSKPKKVEMVPVAMVQAPVDDLQLSKFIDVEAMPDVKDLPKLPEHKRDFAFRYATEFKTPREWADIYGVTQITIKRWIRDPDIQVWIKMTRMERRTWAYGQRLNLERKLFSMMNRLLDMRLTVDNAGEALATVKFVYSVLNNDGSNPNLQRTAEETSKNQVMVNVNTYGGKADVEETEFTPEMIAQLKDETKYLEHMREVLEQEEGLE